MMRTDNWMENLNGPWLGDLGLVLVGNSGGAVLRPSDGFFVGQSAKVCLQVHQTGPGSGDV